MRAAVVIVLLMALATSTQASAQGAQSEMLFVGELRSTTLTRRDWQAERLAQRERSDGIFSISNHCGTASTTFLVVQSTRPLDREVQTTSTIGEWCDPPIAFQTEHWLVLMDSATRQLLFAFEVVEQQRAAYALFLEVEHAQNARSADVRAALTLEPLPTPIRYRTEGFVPPNALSDWVARRPALEIRGGEVWIVRAIPLQRVFPDLDVESLWPRPGTVVTLPESVPIARTPADNLP